MPVKAGEPLTKTTMNFFETDIEWLKKHHGHGYTEAIRDLVRNHVAYKKTAEDAFKTKPEPFLLGDLHDD